MPAWTPSERRGALLVVLLLCLGAAHDLWRARHPRLAPAPSVAAPPTAAGGAEAGPGGPSGGAAPLTAPVDLNRAGLAELDALPGIGPVLAGRILAHRTAHGPFREPEDLLGVPGIGPRLFERLRPLVRVGPAVPPAGSPPGEGGNAIGTPGPVPPVRIPVQERGGPGR